MRAARGPRCAHDRSALIAVGASTGGTEALREFLTALPADAPGVVVVQHMPEQFTRAFADRLERPLRRARSRRPRTAIASLAGHVLIAPGNRHMRVVARRRDATSSASPTTRRSTATARRSTCCSTRAPSVAGANAVGVIMTGMGDDGARGLLAMRNAGAATLAQDEESCVVFGMPKVAVELGAAMHVFPLSRLAEMALASAHEAPSLPRRLA